MSTIATILALIIGIRYTFRFFASSFLYSASLQKNYGLSSGITASLLIVLGAVFAGSLLFEMAVRPFSFVVEDSCSFFAFAIFTYFFIRGHSFLPSVGGSFLRFLLYVSLIALVVLMALDWQQIYGYSINGLPDSQNYVSAHHLNIDSLNEEIAANSSSSGYNESDSDTNIGGKLLFPFYFFYQILVAKINFPLWLSDYITLTLALSFLGVYLLLGFLSFRWKWYGLFWLVLWICGLTLTFIFAYKSLDTLIYAVNESIHVGDLSDLAVRLDFDGYVKYLLYIFYFFCFWFYFLIWGRFFGTLSALITGAYIKFTPSLTDDEREKLKEELFSYLNIGKTDGEETDGEKTDGEETSDEESKKD